MWSGSDDWRRQSSRKRKAPFSEDRRGGGKISGLGSGLALGDQSATLGPRFWAMARTPGGGGGNAGGKNGALRGEGTAAKNKRKAREDARREIGSPGVFARASKSAIKKRRTVRAAKGKKVRDVMTYEHARHMKALNESFGGWVRAAATDALWLDAAQEYVAFATQIEERYLARAGEVMTFGTGDCGQLGHGVEEYTDTEVKYPRVVSMAKLLPAFGGRESLLCLLSRSFYAPLFVHVGAVPRASQPAP